MRHHWDNPDIRRWAFYNCMGAQMCAMDTGKVHGPVAAPEDPTCAICGQLHGLTMVDLVEQDRSLPVYCRNCEDRICPCGQASISDDRLNERHLMIECHGECDDCRERRYGGRETHERLRLFTPAPDQIPGQLEL